MSAPTGGNSTPAQPPGTPTPPSTESQLSFFERVNMQAIVHENCFVKAGMATIGGALLGAGMGIFFSSMDNPLIVDPVYNKLDTKGKVVYTLKGMGRSALFMGKGFAVAGGLFAGSECVVEKLRAKTDLYNSLYAGCFSGAVLGIRAGPKAALAGCAGFAAFSTAIDYFVTGHRF